MDKIDLIIKIKPDKNKRIPYNDFMSVSGQIKTLLNETSIALGIDINIEEWSVGDFRNGSLQYSAVGCVEEGMGSKCEEILNETMLISKPQGKVSPKIPVNLYNAYLGMGENLVDGKVKLSAFHVNGDKHGRAKWYILDQERVNIAKEKLNKEYNIIVLQSNDMVYYGEIKGKIYSWKKEGNKPFVEIRGFDHAENIKCYYDDTMYEEIYLSLENKNNKVYVSGMITMDRKTNKITKIEARKIKIDYANTYYQEGDLDKFFGCVRGLTSGLSPRDYIEKVRENGE